MNVRITRDKSVANRTLLAIDKLQKLCCRWLTSDEQELILKREEQCDKNIDAIFLYLLYTDFGFTPEQLIEFIGKYREKYPRTESDTQILVEDVEEVRYLKDIGVDLDAIYGSDA